jgi:transposase
VSTRNVRLATIHVFFRYVGLRHPDQLILSVAFKRGLEEENRQMRELLREAIHLNNRFDCPEPQLTLSGIMRRVSEIENDLDALPDQRLTIPGERKLQNRYLPHRKKLLTFLYYPGVLPTNNQNEPALRTSVIHRKVTNSFRSDWGANAYADLVSFDVASRSSARARISEITLLQTTFSR